jgi:hypothetical protein
VYGFCDGKGNNEAEYEKLQEDFSSKYNRQFLIAVYAGWIAEFAAGVAVILLYVAVGSLSLSILATARQKLSASSAKLQQLRRNLVTDRDSQAATAGDM